MGLNWERELNMPVGGLSRAFADAEIDNTSGRFLPDYMRGTSELLTAILPRRPIIIGAGFEVSGVDETVPVFSGLLKRSPKVNVSNRQINLEAEDYVGFFDNHYVDRESIFTGVTTDQLLETIFQSSGMTTAQYDLDVGLNNIPFTILEDGAKFADVINELAIAENGQIFQDEVGVFHFWNRQHLTIAPYNQVQRILATSQVLDSESPNEDHIINVVEVSGSIWEKRAAQTIFSLTQPVSMLEGINFEVFATLDDPVLQVTSQTVAGNTLEDGSGSAITVTVVSRTVFSQSVKYVLSAPTNGFLTQLDITGRSAVSNEDLYVRTADSSSVTAYEERPLAINNRYVQDRSWADSLSQLILNSYSEPQNIQKITIRAIPELQLGDLVSWQSKNWRIYGIRGKLDPSAGFLQDLILLKPDLQTYFTIGISDIGGDAAISA